MIFSLPLILQHLNEDDRAILARHARVSNASAPEQLAALASKLANPAYIAQAVGRLSGDERQVLLQWMTHTREDMLIHAGLVGAPNLPLANKLGHMGILYQVQPHTKTWLYVIPHELVAPLFSVLLAQSMSSAPMAHAVRSPRALSASPVWWPMIHDFFMLTSLTRREPLLVTQQGQVYRRIITKLAQKTWNRGNVAQLDTTLYAAHGLGLLSLTPYQKHITVSSYAEEFWTKTPREFFGTLEQYLASHFGMVLQKIFWTCAGGLEPDQWLDLASFHQWAAAQNIFGYKSYQAENFVKFLARLGLAEQECPRWRLTDAPYWAYHQKFEPISSPSVVIQPTGEVLVPPDASYADRWIVDSLATPVKWDRVAVYHIDRESVASAVERGIVADQYIKLWKTVSRTVMPSNIESNIRDWYRALSRHRLVRATLIHSSDASESSQAEQILEKSEAFLERLSPQDLIIADSRVDAVKKSLDRAGIAMLSTIYAPGASHLPDDSSLDWEPYGESIMPVNPPLISAEIPTHLLLPTMDLYTIQRVLREALQQNHKVTVYFKDSEDTQARALVMVSGFIAQGRLQGVDADQKAFVIPVHKLVLVQPVMQ